MEGWLLLALHRLPRAGDSAAAVLNAVGVSLLELGCLSVCIYLRGFFVLPVSWSRLFGCDIAGGQIGSFSVRPRAGGCVNINTKVST